MQLNQNLLFALFLALLCTLGTALARPNPNPEPASGCSTNAECLKRGLKVLPPTRARHRRDVVPEPSNRADTYIWPFRVIVSTTPGGAAIGWIGSSTNDGRYNNIVDTGTPEGALVLLTNVAPGSPSETLLNFKLQTPPSPGYIWYGIYPNGDANNGNMNPDTYDHSAQGHAANVQTSKTSTPEQASVWKSAGGTTETYWESAIFNLDTATNAITSIWYQADPAVYGPTTTLEWVVQSGVNLITVTNAGQWTQFGFNQQVYLRMERLAN